MPIKLINFKTNIMIKIIEVEREKKQEVRNDLIEKGFISATLIYGLTDEELYKKIKIKKSWLPKASELKRIAYTPWVDLECYCLQYGERTKSYWYRISDLRKLFSQVEEKPVVKDGSNFCRQDANEQGMAGNTAGYVGMPAHLYKTPRPNWFRRMLNFIFG